MKTSKGGIDKKERDARNTRIPRRCSHWATRMTMAMIVDGIDDRFMRSMAITIEWTAIAVCSTRCARHFRKVPLIRNVVLLLRLVD